MRLGALVRPLTAAQFLDRHWPGVPRVAHGDVGRLGDWVRDPAWSDPSKLLRGTHDGIRVWRPGAGGARVTADVAERLLASRDATLTVDGVRFPSLDRFRKGLARELGTPARATQCNVYLSPKGGGTTAHFDSHEVFFLQLSGRKRWRYAKAVDFPFPPGFAFDGGTFKAVETDGLGLFAGRAPKLPRRMTSVVLAPGSLLFLPRGTWHVPTTLEDSVHVTLALNVPTFRHVLLETIGRRMMGDPRWREPAASLFLNAGSPPQERARAKLAALLRELGPLTAGLDEASVLDRRRRRS
ncbi:MAG TPA: cupin domain-containing protein [Planctomycetota bacterium]